jgi:hypothetical protein
MVWEQPWRPGDAVPMNKDKWLIIEYISEDKNTRGQRLTAPGYYSEAFNEFKVHEKTQMSSAFTVTPVRWKYMK